jgi:lysozyme
MSIVDTALPLIKAEEGFRAKPYLCPAGVWTIGYGTTVYPDERKVSVRDPAITETEALAFLRLDAEARWTRIAPHLTRAPTDGQGAAMLSLAYNIGTSAFLKSTCLRKFNAGDITGAADEFLRWNKGGGKVLPGLVARRAAERALFLEGN